MSVFKWETLREIGPYELTYAKAVPGRVLEVELTSGRKIRVWRGDDGRSFFCHGLAFGGKEAPGGPVSPFSGEAVETILQEHYRMVPEGEAKPGDILVWGGPYPSATPHSALLTDPVIDTGKNKLAYATRLQTKNGMLPETNSSLEELIDRYGESYHSYRIRAED